jgi:hypothetical protein
LLAHKIVEGFDLVGQEDNGRPLIDFADRLLAFQKEVARQELYIPFLFHAGETLGDGTRSYPWMQNDVLGLNVFSGSQEHPLTRTFMMRFSWAPNESAMGKCVGLSTPKTEIMNGFVVASPLHVIPN